MTFFYLWQYEYQSLFSSLSIDGANVLSPFMIIRPGRGPMCGKEISKQFDRILGSADDYCDHIYDKYDTFDFVSLYANYPYSCFFNAVYDMLLHICINAPYAMVQV